MEERINHIDFNYEERKMRVKERERELDIYWHQMEKS